MRISIPATALLCALAGTIRAQGEPRDAGAAEGGAAEGGAAEGGAAEGGAAAPYTRGFLSSSGFFYRENAARLVSGNDQASPEDLAFADLRARLEVGNLAGSRWGGLGDFRLRLTSDELAARGFEGGGEYHLREAYVVRRGRRVDVSVGRQILREVDAIRVDGASLLFRPRQPGPWEYGAFAGLYPNPFSRSLDTDYRRGQSGAGLPAAGGAWAAYNTGRNHGGFGVGGIAPRDRADSPDPEPTRVFASWNGYTVVGDRLDLFHYLVADLAGRAGANLLTAQLGASWRASERLRIEAGFGHMSTYAVEIYVRDLLETPDPAPETGAPVQNNLALVRIASDEGRLGAVVFLPRRVDLQAGARVRRRDALVDAELPMEISALAPDTQFELSAGIRQRDSLLGLDLSALLIAIRGGRTGTSFAILRARRVLLQGRLDAELQADAVDYSDRCEEGDPTCTGTLDGRTLRAGGQLVLVPTARWMLLSDYRFAWNTAERAGMEQPAIRSHTLFLRLQRSF